MTRIKIASPALSDSKTNPTASKFGHNENFWPFMDYIIADKALIPDEMQPHYSEKVIYLFHSYMPADDKREISSQPMTRTEMDLPEQGMVLCCFNNIYKIGFAEFLRRPAGLATKRPN